jgi:hypothetical protein
MREEYFVSNWKIMRFTLPDRAKMAPSRLARDDFRGVSLEILYDRALGRTAKAGLRLRFSPSFSLCYATEQGESLPVISLDRCASNSFQVTEI